MRLFHCFTAVLLGSAWLGPALLGSASATEAPKYSLRYRFEPGETLRWDVVHRSRVRTTVSGTTQTAETTSTSVKLWRVVKVNPDGSAAFEHMVEWVDMRQKLTGCDEVRYDSRTDQKAPPGFEDVARSVGVPLSTVTLDPRGKVLHRKHYPVKAAVHGQGEITIPLPDEPVSVGHRWSFPHTIDVTLNSGGVKKVKAMQTFTLESVKTGVAAIRVATQILTPIDDPAVQSQLIQRESAGTVRFDLDAGRILSQQMDVDKSVVGFRGEASSLHYLTRFTEDLLPQQPRTADRAKPDARK